MPLAKPALITLGLFIFLGTWNSFVWPLVILSDSNMYPLTVGLSLFREESTADWPRIFAASVMGSVPLVLLFPGGAAVPDWRDRPVGDEDLTTAVARSQYPVASNGNGRNRGRRVLN